MNIVVYVPSFPPSNFGDHLGYEAVDFFLNSCFVDSNRVLVAVEREVDPSFYDYVKNADLFVLACSPWFWYGCVHSVKYQLLEKILGMNKRMKKIALSVGSCFPNERDVGCITDSDCKHLFELWDSFDLIHVRSSSVFDILKVLGVDEKTHGLKNFDITTLLPLKYPLEIEPVEKVLAVYDPRNGFNASFLGSKRRDEILNFEKVLISDFGYTPVCHGVGDLQSFPEADLIVTTSKFLRRVRLTKQLISGRIHFAIPCFAYGIPTKLFPVDSRFRACEEVGVEIIEPHIGEVDFGDGKIIQPDFKNFFNSLKKEVWEVMGWRFEG